MQNSSTSRFIHYLLSLFISRLIETCVGKFDMWLKIRKLLISFPRNEKTRHGVGGRCLSKRSKCLFNISINRQVVEHANLYNNLCNIVLGNSCKQTIFRGVNYILHQACLLDTLMFTCVYIIDEY